MLIDLHCHILPGIDDGAKTMDESLAMARAAVDDGITHILCTPHHLNGQYINNRQEVIEKVASVQAAIDAEGIPLELYEGQEVHLNEEIPEQLRNKNILCADLSDKYFLLEFPANDIPAFAEPLINEVLVMGKTPIIVHPERNGKFIDDPNRLIPFIDMGCLAQLTAPSICGHFGKKIQKTAEIMLDHNMVHMMASDAHNVTTRPFMMKQGFDIIHDEFGEDVEDFMKNMARSVLNGDEVAIYEPTPYKKHFSLFN